MNDEMIDLARRAVACRHWRWMAGMLIHADTISSDGARVAGWHESVTYVNNGELLGWLQYCEDRSSFDDAEALPDLSDPATLGCLEELAREAWSDHLAHAVAEVDDGGAYWSVVSPLKLHALSGPWLSLQTRAEALVAALEAAPVE